MQPIPKRVKDFTNKTPKLACPEIVDVQNLDKCTEKNDSAFDCEDLSFVIEDILSKRIQNPCLADSKQKKKIQVYICPDLNGGRYLML